MTSPLEKKLKIAGPVLITANRLNDGAVIYRTAYGDWTTDFARAAVVSTAPAAAELLAESGASEISVMATHALLSDPAVDRLKAAPISRVVVTDTLPVADDRYFDKLEVLSVAKLISDAIGAVFEDTSVSEIFGGENLA